MSVLALLLLLTVANPNAEEQRLDAAAARARALPAAQRVNAAMPIEASYSKLADQVRFKQRDPKRAITLYRKAQATHLLAFPSGSGSFAPIDIADVYQFDLRDKKTAAAEYENFLRALATAPPRPEFAWMRAWLAHEIQYLRTGKPYKGVVTPEEAEAFRAFLYFFGTGETARGETATINSPASHLTFARTYSAASLLKDEKALDAWLTRNDPGGYWRACYLTLAGYAAQLPAAKVRGSLLFAGVPMPLDPALAMTKLGKAYVARK